MSVPVDPYWPTVSEIVKAGANRVSDFELHCVDGGANINIDPDIEKPRQTSGTGRCKASLK